MSSNPRRPGSFESDRGARVDEARIDVRARGVHVFAPAGTCTFAPTASILLPRITIVPRSISRPVTG